MISIDGMDAPVIPTATFGASSYDWSVYNGGQIQHAADPTIITYTYITDFDVESTALNETVNGFSRISVMNPPNQDGNYTDAHPLQEITFRVTVPAFVTQEIKFLGYLELPEDQQALEVLLDL